MNRALGVLTLGCVLLGCSKSSRPHVEKVVVDAAEGLDVLGLSKDEVRAQLIAALSASKFVILDEKRALPEGVTPWRVIAALQVEEPDPDALARPKVTCGLSVHQRGASESWEFESQVGIEARSNSIDDIQQAARDGLQRAIGRAVAETSAVIGDLSLTDEALLKGLAGPEGAAKDAAVQVLARRKHPLAQKALIERLASEDLERVHRAMGQLVEMKAKDAVPSMIEAARGKDATFQREVVFALGEIGGEDSEAYLFTLAQGHDDPVVRASAQRALDDLKQKLRPKSVSKETP